MKDLQVEFKEETKKDVLTPDDYGGYYYSDEYVEWLEKKVIPYDCLLGTVRILPGASKWMKQKGYWFENTYPDSIDNLLAEIDCDYTDLKGDDCHYGIIIYNYEELGIIGVHPQWLKQC